LLLWGGVGGGGWIETPVPSLLGSPLDRYSAHGAGLPQHWLESFSSSFAHILFSNSTNMVTLHGTFSFIQRYSFVGGKNVLFIHIKVMPDKNVYD
jgi:hypothetical protein